MLSHLEETIYIKNFFRNSISEKVIDLAHVILNDAHELSSHLKNEYDLRLKFKSIDTSNQAALVEAATLAVAACIRSCNKSWIVNDNVYIWNVIPRVEQIVASLELCKKGCGRFALQRTGEGKTITILITIAILSLDGAVHILTANDYLALRDCQWIGPVLGLLGIDVSFLTKDLLEKKSCYKTRAIFGSDKEFLFDYLRDSLRTPDVPALCDKRQSCIVDEADHILLDELLTPAIISKERSTQNPFYAIADSNIRKLISLQDSVCKSILSKVQEMKSSDASIEYMYLLVTLRNCGKNTPDVNAFLERNQRAVITSEKFETRMYMKGEDCEKLTSDLYFTVNWQDRSCTFTERGMSLIENEIGETIFTLPPDTSDTGYNIRLYQLISAYQHALEVHVVFRRDIDYIISNSEVKVITSSIGRADSQKRFGYDLAAAVAYKEGIVHHSDSSNVTRTSITQFVKEYNHFAALSGTLIPDQEEFEKLYNAKSFPVPTCKPIIVKHHQGLIFSDAESKYDAIIRETLYNNSFGRPVLIGTGSIVTSEKIVSKILALGIPCRILNAKNEDEEAIIITRAGDFGALTVATNMAGRGCDIAVTKDTDTAICNRFLELIQKVTIAYAILDIQCYSLYEYQLLCNQLDDSKIEYTGNCSSVNNMQILIKGRGRAPKIQLTFSLGLHVIIAECNSTRRIETQLRGRTGRQGNPGSSSLYISLEDEALMPVSSVRWLGLFIDSWFKLSNTPFFKDLLLRVIYSATESDLRLQRSERLFYDSISETIRKRFLLMREKGCCSSFGEIIRTSINSYIGYLNEEAGFISDHEKRTGMIGQRLRETFSLYNASFPSCIVTEDGNIDSGLEMWIAGFLVAKNIQLSDTSVRYLYCSCIDGVWGNFLAALDFYQEQSQLLAYAGRDPKVSYIDIIFEKWHESVYRLFEIFLKQLFLRDTEQNTKMKIATSSKNDDIEALLAL
jgi:preprotein translocase subunit SecA